MGLLRLLFVLALLAPSSWGAPSEKRRARVSRPSPVTTEGPASWARADKLFDGRLYQEALKDYEVLLASAAVKEERLKAVYRIAESKALLFRYGEALQSISELKTPADPLWRGRFDILRAEVNREFLAQYGFAAREDVIEGEEDVTRKTPQEMHRDISAAFSDLWEIRRSLATSPLEKETYFVALEKDSALLYPSLWDFAVLRWTDYLLQEAPDDGAAPKPAALDLLKDSYTSDRSAKPAELPPTRLAALLMETAATGSERERSQARELWKVSRLLLPYGSPQKFSWSTDWKVEDAQAVETLTRWTDLFQNDGSKAEAGYEAANLMRQRATRFEETLGLCRRVEKDWSGTPGAKKCAKLRAEIELPALSLSVEVSTNGHSPRVNTKNLREVHFRLYATTPEELRNMGKRDYERSWSHALNRVDEDLLKKFISEKTPRFRWSRKPELKTNDELYEPKTTPVEMPKADLGIYLLMASQDPGFSAGQSLISGAFVNVTEILLLGTAGFEETEKHLIYVPPEQGGETQRRANSFHFYALNARTGEPLQRASLDVQLRAHRGSFEDVFLNTDEVGRAQLPTDVQLAPHADNYHQADPLARFGESFAYWASPAYVNYNVPTPILLMVDLDRPIYRPGQKVQFKVTALTRTPDGYRTYGGSSKAALRATDANGNEVYKAEITFNEMGSAVGEFLVPTGRLLGGYNLQASLSDWHETFHGSGSFAVEEYKRPEFEVKLHEAKGAWRFGKEASVTGEARYYFGGPVPESPVVVRVYRERFIPWFCWWWSWRSSGGERTEVFKKELKTDMGGAFSFTFTPEPADPNETDVLPAQFTVEAEARDTGGRTIEAKKTYRAGKNAHLFSVEMPSGFLTAGKPAVWSTKLLNLNEQPVKGNALYEVHRLAKTPEQEDSGPGWGHFPESPSLDRLYKDVPDGEKAAEGTLSYDGKKAAELGLPPLKAGAYRLTLKTKDPWGEEVSLKVHFLVADEKGCPVKIFSLTIPEHKEYQVGEKARFLLGSSNVKEIVHVEIWGGPLLLSHTVLAGGGIRILELPVTDDHKGGFTVRWFGVRDFKVRSGQANVGVPWKDKDLRVKLRWDKKLKPGQKATWSLSAKDADGRPAEGEALVGMFDRSLEYYAQLGSSWVKGLYLKRRAWLQGMSSLFHPGTGTIRIETGWIRKIIDLFHEAIEEPEPPSLRINQSRLRYGFRGRTFGGRGGMSKGENFMLSDEGAMAGASMAAAPDSALAGAGAAVLEKSMAKEAKSAAPSRAQGLPAEAPVQVRSEFAETAFFKPQLRLKNGNASFSFEAPEQLTGWKITAQVVTQDLKTGLLSEEAVTQKDLMVRVEMPRFFREGDEGTLKVVVHNETDAELSGNLTLSVFVDSSPAESRLSLGALTREFKVKPHGLEPFSWPVKAPRELVNFKVRAVARSGEVSDAEEREIPILPSRSRLVESTVVALNGNVTKTLTMKAFKKEDPTRQNESLALQVDPQLALTLLNSIPFLVHYPYECVEQTLNRYVPLSVINEVYKKHPKIAQATAKVPKRETITPPWDRTDPRRMMTLQETPWDLLSQGRKSFYPVIDLLRPETVERERADALEKLKSAQLSNGAFPWFPGGRPDPYMTLYVLAGFAEALRYGVPVPDDVVRRALRYVNDEIPRRLKPTQPDVSLMLYAAYVVTSIPAQRYPEARQGFKFAKVWADYADKHTDALTPFGRAYAAFVYWRLGEKEKGDLYLKRAMDGVREDPIAGVYWAPEKNSWLWFNDTVEKHAFLLKTLQALRPKDPRIPGMVQWLLFNRKGNEWKSTKASVAAVYALLDFMQASGALDKGDTFTVRWGEEVNVVQVEPDDWLSKPFRWMKTGMEITPAFYAPKVEKSGPGFAFASLNWAYSTDRLPEPSEPGLIEVERKVYNRVQEGKEYRLKPLRSGDTVRVGDQIEIQLKVRTRSSFEYVHLKDPKGAGFEAEELRSGWKWDQVGRYEEPRDSLTNFFFDWIPHGEYILRYRVRPTTPGKYRIGAAVLQSMYAPEFTAHSAGMELAVAE